jgi:uncharacterized protein (TIGR02118 family)
MVKLVILLCAPTGAPDFDTRYNETLMLLEKLPGVRRKSVGQVWGSAGGPPPFASMLELWFDDRAALQAALLSPTGRQAGRDLFDFAANPLVLYVDTSDENYTDSADG